ncbi:methyl-accepting chemotaxis protein [Bacillus sp. PS06]|nr:methyl-accepting chemotaxis protein [Bacillus sp. PS06]MBD8071064.1 methyl-accepting chemotaxis protein [Bacillus sp. PS06]
MLLKKQLLKKKKKTNGQKRTFQFNSVGMKLFVLFFISIVVCVVAVGLFSYTNSKKVIESKVSEGSQQTITQTAEKLNIVFDDYVKRTVSLIVDQDLMKFPVTASSSDNEFDRLTAIKSAEDRLKSYLYVNKEIASISIIPIDKDKEEISTEIAVPDEIRNSKWFEDSIALDGTPRWIESNQEGILGNGEPTFGLSRLVKLANGNYQFVLLMEIKLSQLGEYLESAQLGQAGYTMVINEENQVIYSPDSELIGTEHIIDDAEMIKVSNQIGEFNWDVAGAFPKSELADETNSIRILTILMALAAALIAVVIGFVVVKMIGKPITQLSSLMLEGIRGNLTVRSSIKSKDEIGQLAQNFNDMMDQITHLVNQVNEATEEVLSTATELTKASQHTAEAAREVATATEEIALGASTLASEAEKGTYITTTISDQMKKVIQTNESLGSTANEVNMVSEQGTVYMNELISKTNSTEQMNLAILNKVDELKESTKSIRKILDLLNNMTKQTNILSLNAAIEAARAGEAGRGFMVVADEIRKLADQSSQSIKIVGEITDGIQQDIDETVDVLSTAYPLFQEQVTAVKESNTIFLSVKEEMFSFLDELGIVSRSIYELENSQSTLSSAMENVNAVAEESSATSEEVASLSVQQLSIGENLIDLSTKLEKVSQELTSSLQKFKL